MSSGLMTNGFENRHKENRSEYYLLKKEVAHYSEKEGILERVRGNTVQIRHGGLEVLWVVTCGGGKTVKGLGPRFPTPACLEEPLPRAMETAQNNGNSSLEIRDRSHLLYTPALPLDSLIYPEQFINLPQP